MVNKISIDELNMKEALIEANKALQLDEVPIGAVVVCNDKIIGRGYNQKEQTNNPITHAEIIAIMEACKYKQDWRLDDCTLYVTVEPCLMCCGAIIQSRIKRLVYGTANKKFGYVESINKILNDVNNNHRVEVETGICIDTCQKLMKDFFESKRK